MNNCSKCVNANVIVATARVQVFETNREILNTPASELLEPIVNVSFDRVVPLRNKILVIGTITKNILYKDTGNTVRHQPVTIPFSKEVEIPGFNPGSLVNGRFFNCGNDFKFCLEDIFVNQTLIDPNTVQEEIVFHFVVKVLKEEKICISTKPAPVFHCSAEIPCKTHHCWK